MIEIETKEMDKASEYAEKALKYMGKVMQCLTEWDEEGGYGERSGSQGGYSRSMMGSRSGYGSRYGMRGGDMSYRDEEEWEDDEMMGERRGRRRRDSMGRYR